MATFLFDNIVFGPVFSRRLGVSLGINLLPPNRKVCNFNCIYCECGHTQGADTGVEKMPGRKEVRLAMDTRLNEMKTSGQDPDVITFAGNGEPTIHPEFAGIIDDTIELRNKYFPGARVAVLSNSTTLNDPVIRAALYKVDQSILKLDSAINETLQAHNRPGKTITANEIIDHLRSFEGDIILQTMFIRGEVDGRKIDNTTTVEINAWLKALKKIMPAEVQIYTVSRDTPAGNNISRVPGEDLEAIALQVEKLGFKTQGSA